MYYVSGSFTSFYTIRIKHGFSCINVCLVPSKMLKTEAEDIGSKPPICCAVTEKGEARLLGEIIWLPRNEHIESCLIMH